MLFPFFLCLQQKKNFIVLVWIDYFFSVLLLNITIHSIWFVLDNVVDVPIDRSILTDISIDEWMDWLIDWLICMCLIVYFVCTSLHPINTGKNAIYLMVQKIIRSNKRKKPNIVQKKLTNFLYSNIFFFWYRTRVDTPDIIQIVDDVYNYAFCCLFVIVVVEKYFCSIYTSFLLFNII